jgi:hypothetical protein
MRTLTLEGLKHVTIAFEEFIRGVYHSMRSLGAVAVFSRADGISHVGNSSSGPCVVMGNGPSLRRDLEHLLGKSLTFTAFAVNEFGESDLYASVKPRFYVLHDPYYWDESLPREHEEKRSSLFQAINQGTTWPTVVLAPFEMRASAVYKTGFGSTPNPNITFRWFNRTPVECKPWLAHKLCRRGLGLPSAQNVLLAAIVLAVNLGFSPIIVLGADHTLHENIEVGDDNQVYVRQIHFYDGESVQPKLFSRSYIDHRFVTMGELFAVWSRAFHGYHRVREYAEDCRAQVFNSTSRSFIDAFPRLTFEKAHAMLLALLKK